MAGGPGYAGVAGTLEIHGCATLDTLRLPALRHMDRLVIYANPALTSLAGLGGGREIDFRVSTVLASSR